MKKWQTGHDRIAPSLYRAGAILVYIRESRVTKRIAEQFRSYPREMRTGLIREHEIGIPLSLQTAREAGRTAYLTEVTEELPLSVPQVSHGLVILLLEADGNMPPPEYPVFLPEDPESMEERIVDAMEYSELLGIPCIVWIPQYLLSAGQTVPVRSLKRYPVNLREDRATRRIFLQNRIEERQVHWEAGSPSERSGRKCIILSYGDTHAEAAALLSDILQSGGSRNWSLCHLTAMGGPMEKKQSEMFRGAEQVIRLLPSLTTGLSFSERGEAVRQVLRQNLPKELRPFLKDAGAPEERLRLRVPTLPSVDVRMCPGCLHRQLIQNRIPKAEDPVVLYESVFCETLGISVVSGICREGLHVTTKRENAFALSEVLEKGRLLSYEASGPCPGKHYGNVPVLQRNRCTDCERCVQETGCRALWTRGWKVHLDRTLCTGCGSCLSLCEREALCIG